MTATLTREIFQQPLELTSWSVNYKTSSVRFEIAQRNLLGKPSRKIEGSFKDYSGFMETGRESFCGGEIRFAITAGSIDTSNTRRDKHLTSSAFLNAEMFPVIRFYSLSFQKGKDNNYILEGDCVIKGITRTILFDVAYLGMQEDGSGTANIAFKASATIDRHDFGIRSNLFFEALVEKKIGIVLDLEFFQLT